MKTTTTAKRPQQSIVVIHSGKAATAIRSVELSTKKRQPFTVNAAIEMWVAWLTKNAPQQSSAQSISYIRAWARDANVGTMPVSAIEEEHINEWVNEKDGNKLGTRRVRLAIVRSFFKYLAIKELLTAPNPSTLASVDYNALSHKQKEAAEIQPFTADEFKKLVDHLNLEIMEIHGMMTASDVDNIKSSRFGRLSALTKKLLAKRSYLIFWKSAAVISRCAGLRMGDVCQLEWDCFGRKFTVWTDKKNKRVQPYIWNQELFDQTVAQIPTDNDQYCFPEQRATYLDVKRRPGLNMQFSRLCEKLKLHGHSFHGLRHTYATECHRAGIPTPHIAQSMGHSNTRTTDGYIH